jgi:hypothetical protein
VRFLAVLLSVLCLVACRRQAITPRDVTLWVWDRAEDLRGVDPAYGFAVLLLTVELKEGAATFRPRLRPFQNDTEREKAARESGQLAGAPSGATFLARRTIEWVTAHPRDTRGPESLHLDVQATRVSCEDKRKGAASRRQFELLNRQFPKSDWAKKTPYWFN